MGLRITTPMLLQITVVTLLSLAASYAFENTQTTYQINGLCFYRYFAYGCAILFCYICVSHYNKFAAIGLSFVLSALALSTSGPKVIELFPSLVPFLAMLFGITSVLVVPSSRGRGFFEFLAILVLPAILAESRIGGGVRLLATTESIGYYELAAITICIVGGYFYLRYAILANLRCLEFVRNGGSVEDVTQISEWCNRIIFVIVTSASAIAAFLMTATPIAANALQTAFAELPLYVVGSAMVIGIAITIILYIFQFSQKSMHDLTDQK